MRRWHVERFPWVIDDAFLDGDASRPHVHMLRGLHAVVLPTLGRGLVSWSWRRVVR